MVWEQFLDRTFLRLILLSLTNSALGIPYIKCKREYVANQLAELNFFLCFFVVTSNDAIFSTSPILFFHYVACYIYIVYAYCGNFCWFGVFLFFWVVIASVSYFSRRWFIWESEQIRVVCCCVSIQEHHFLQQNVF